MFLAKKMQVFVAGRLIILGLLLSGTRAWAQCEVDVLTANDPLAWQHFGLSVATSLDGQFILVGAPQDDENGSTAGAAYFFALDQGIWNFQNKLLASDGEAGDSFGFTVVITVDGNNAIIAAPEKNDGVGAVYVFERRGSTWFELDKLIALDPAVGAFMGLTLAASSNALTIAAGADTNEKAGENVGSLYVFVRQGDDWIQQAKLTASDAEEADGFGNNVAISSDGNLVLIGSKSDNDVAFNAGSVYVFERSGEIWTEIDQFYASVPVQNANFGAAISLSDDGNTALIGARNEGAGAAYIFVRQEQAWIEQAHLLPPPGLGGFFGADVSISADGNTAMVAASEEFSRGSAYIFARGAGSNHWYQQARLIGCNTAQTDYFATSVALSGNGNIAVAGARWEDGQFMNQGFVHVFDLSMEPCHVGDLSCNGEVDLLDLQLLLLNWGPCENCFLHCDDLTGDCIVNTDDLLVLFANWG